MATVAVATNRIYMCVLCTYIRGEAHAGWSFLPSLIRLYLPRALTYFSTSGQTGLGRVRSCSPLSLSATPHRDAFVHALERTLGPAREGEREEEHLARAETPETSLCTGAALARAHSLSLSSFLLSLSLSPSPSFSRCLSVSRWCVYTYVHTRWWPATYNGAHNHILGFYGLTVARVTVVYLFQLCHWLTTVVRSGKCAVLLSLSPPSLRRFLLGLYLPGAAGALRSLSVYFSLSAWIQ